MQDANDAGYYKTAAREINSTFVIKEKFRKVYFPLTYFVQLSTLRFNQVQR